MQICQRLQFISGFQEYISENWILSAEIPLLSANQKIDCTLEVNINQTLKYRWGVTNVCYI